MSMIQLASKVIAALRADFVELSTCRINGYSVCVEVIKKEPRHIPEDFDARYHVQMNNLTVAEIDIIRKSDKLKVTLQRYQPDWHRDRCEAVGKRFALSIGPGDVKEQLDNLTLRLSKHMRKVGGLPDDLTRFYMRWNINFAAKDVASAKLALREAIADLDSKCYSMNGCETYALTLRRCPVGRHGA